VARRKSIVAQFYSALQKSRAEREREQRRAASDYATRVRQREKEREREQQQRLRAAEQAQRERARQEAAAEKARQQHAAQRKREAAQRKQELQRLAVADARERQRQEQEAKREEQRRALERRLAEATVRTELVHAQVDSLERLLRDRTRGLVGTRPAIEQAFNADADPQALADAVQQTLAASAYPEGLSGTCVVAYRSEARELLIEAELPRQAVVPAVTGYRYVKTKELIQPEPRKEADIKKLCTTAPRCLAGCGSRRPTAPRSSPRGPPVGVPEVVPVDASNEPRCLVPFHLQYPGGNCREVQVASLAVALQVRDNGIGDVC